MVSKITVMALVLIVAAPILIGYGMAFEEVERTTWTESNTRGISGLLYNAQSWDPVPINAYQLNSDVIEVAGFSDYQYPLYKNVQASPVTSLPIAQESRTSSQDIDSDDLAGSGSAYFIPNGDGYITVTIMYLDEHNQTVTDTIDIVTLAFDNYTVFGYKSDGTTYTYTNCASVDIGYPNDPYTVQYEVTSGSYADITSGWTVPYDVGSNTYYSVNIGTLTDNVLVTVDLGELIYNTAVGDSFTWYINPDGDYDPASLIFTYYNAPDPADSYLTVATVGWSSKIPFDTTSTVVGYCENNVWQIRMNLDKYQIDYVKSWPGQLGAAFSYLRYSIPYHFFGVNTMSAIISLGIDAGAIMRVDYADGRGFSYPVMKDITYDPAAQLYADPTRSYAMRLADIGQVGSSLSWGGETYTITDGKITVANKKIALTDLLLESRYIDGERTNYINGKAISTGANSLQLSGTWGAVVSLTDETSDTTTSTEWTPGKFAWNGVDQSFALMGLITCAAVFVGLGMYGARSGAKVGKLMIICGAAAFVFLAIM